MKTLIISTVDISKKNGQGSYAKSVIKSFLTDKRIDRFNISVCAPRTNSNIDSQINYYLPAKIKNRSIFWSIKLQLKLIFILLEVKPDIIICSLKPNLISLFIYQFFYKIKIFSLVEGNSKLNFPSFMPFPVDKISIFFIECLLKISYAVYPAYINAAYWVTSVINNNRVKVIPIGVDSDVFVLKKNRIFKKRDSNQINILYIGSFRFVHRVDLLIRLAYKNPNINVTLIGNGSEFNSIVNLVNQYNLSQQVNFIGEIKQEEIVNFIDNIDLSWSYTSLNHWGVPIKAIESLALNLPVIVSYREDFNFIEENGYGILLDNEDIDYILEKIHSFMFQYSFNDFNSRDYVLKNYSWKKFVDSFLDDIGYG